MGDQFTLWFKQKTGNCAIKTFCKFLSLKNIYRIGCYFLYNDISPLKIIISHIYIYIFFLFLCKNLC